MQSNAEQETRTLLHSLSHSGALPARIFLRRGRGLGKSQGGANGKEGGVGRAVCAKPYIVPLKIHPGIDLLSGATNKQMVFHCHICHIILMCDWVLSMCFVRHA